MDRIAISFSTFSAHQLGGIHPFAEKNEFEYPPHAAVGSFWLTIYPDQTFLFRL
jgi:hypothetical protein